LLPDGLTLCEGFAGGDCPPAVSLDGCSSWAVGVAPVGDGQGCYDPCLVIDGVQVMPRRVDITSSKGASKCLPRLRGVPGNRAGQMLIQRGRAAGVKVIAYGGRTCH
jgi:hypothetical protein